MSSFSGSLQVVHSMLAWERGYDSQVVASFHFCSGCWFSTEVISRPMCRNILFPGDAVGEVAAVAH